MSLINKMLKDLENRGGLKGEDSTFESSNQQATHAKSAKKSNPTFLMLSGLFIVVYLAGYYWFTQHEKTNVEAHQNTLVKHEPLHQQPMTQSGMDADKPDQKTQNEVIIAEINAAIESENQTTSIQETNTPVQNEPVTGKTADIQVPVTTAKKPKIAIDQTQPSKELDDTKLTAKTTIKNTVASVKETEKPVVVAKAEPIHDASIEAAPTEKISVAQATKPKTQPTTIAKPLVKAHFVKQTSASQKSKHLYQEAISLVQQGRVTEAQDVLAKALLEYPANEDARQTLAALLLDNNRVAEAKTVLSQGLLINPEHVQFRMAVARLEVELGSHSAALNTLLDGSKQAANNAKYQAFLATMLQRENRHEEAVKHFQYALGIDRGMTKAFVGLGMSLQALNRLEDAQVAYNNAQSNSSIHPNLKSFLDVRIKEVNHRISSR